MKHLIILLKIDFDPFTQSKWLNQNQVILFSKKSSNGKQDARSNDSATDIFIWFVF